MYSGIWEHFSNVAPFRVWWWFFLHPTKIANKISRSHDVNLVFRSFCSFSLTLTMVQNHLVGWLQISKCIKTNAKRWCWCCGAKQLKHIVLFYISVKTVKACQNHHHFDALWSTSSIKIPSTALWSASVGEASPPLAYQASWGCIDPTWRNLLSYTRFSYYLLQYMM